MSTFRRFFSGTLIAVLVLGGVTAISPPKAKALLPVTDVAHIAVSSGNAINNAVTTIETTITASRSLKELLNGIFWTLAKVALKSVVRSTVNWINSGFDGSPAFVSDLKKTMESIGDGVANDFIHEFNSSLGIDSPFRDIIGQEILGDYYRSTSRDGFFLENQYTLKQIAAQSGPSGDDAAFLRGDFSKGGFASWFSASSDCGNNPLCSLSTARDALRGRIAGEKHRILTELGFGNGFLSFRGSCKVSAASAADSSGETPADLGGADKCLEYNIKTPGTVIHDSLSKALGSGVDTLVTADEFDEIVSALMGQLMNAVLGSGGLSGTSAHSAARGGGDYFSQKDSGPGSGGTSAGAGVASAFLQILDTQTALFTTYSGDWLKINGAATAAKEAVIVSTCITDKQTVVTNQILPIITAAATAIGAAPTAIAGIDRIRAGVLGIDSQSINQQTQALATASSDFDALQSGGTLPTTAALQYASDQARDTGTATPASLFSQMTQLATQARCGG